MALDNFWANTAYPVYFEEPPKLDGALFPKNGDGKFKGDKYEVTILDVTGISIRCTNLPTHTVEKIAKKLIQTEYGTTAKLITREEYYDLCKMFNAYASAEATLHGWW